MFQWKKIKAFFKLVSTREERTDLPLPSYKSHFFIYLLCCETSAGTSLRNIQCAFNKLCWWITHTSEMLSLLSRHSFSFPICLFSPHIYFLLLCLCEPSISRSSSSLSFLIRPPGYCFFRDHVENQRLICFSGRTIPRKHNRFHLHPQPQHTMSNTTAHKQAEGWESCHGNVYKSHPEECKQNWVELLSDKRVNFRQSCCCLPVLCFDYNTAHWRIIFSDWRTDAGFFNPHNPATYKKFICVYRRLVRWGISLTHSAPCLKACELRNDYCLGSSACNWFTLKFPAGILICDAYSQSSDYPHDRSLLSSQGRAEPQRVKQKLWDVWRDRVHMSPVPRLCKGGYQAAWEEHVILRCGSSPADCCQPWWENTT